MMIPHCPGHVCWCGSRRGGSGSCEARVALVVSESTHRSVANYPFILLFLTADSLYCAYTLYIRIRVYEHRPVMQTCGLFFIFSISSAFTDSYLPSMRYLDSQVDEVDMYKKLLENKFDNDNNTISDLN